MKTCDQIQKVIYAYLDGELSASDNQMVENHILDCQQCSEILLSQKRFLNMLDSANLREKGPSELRATISRKIAPKNRFRLQLPAFLTFRYMAGSALAGAMMIALFFTFFSSTPSSPTFIESTVISHIKNIEGETDLEIRTNDPLVVAGWLEEQLGIKADFPTFSDPDVILLGARVGRYKEEQVGFLSYQVHNTPVTLAVVNKTADTAIISSNHRMVGDRRINFRKSQNYNVVSWSVCTTNFALISNLPRQGKQGCAVCHAKGSGLIDLSDFYTLKT